MSDYNYGFDITKVARVESVHDMIPDLREHAELTRDDAIKNGVDLTDKAERIRILYETHVISTKELVAELYAVWTILHDNELKEKYKGVSWKDFCDAAGIHPETARNYIRKYYEEDDKNAAVGEEDLTESSDKRKLPETIIERKVSTIRNIVNENGTVKEVTETEIVIGLDFQGVKREIRIPRNK